MQYRAELDGLRAVAVILVLLHHAAFTFLGRSDWFAAADIGVDIFFVLSGYLITTIILLEIRESGTFSFRNFYERRARRILPVLFFVILVSFPVAFKLLSSIDLTAYLGSVISIVFFGSNIFFYLASENFTPDSATVDPFIHTWSLAIEEQFYVVFPIILLLSIRYAPKFTLSIFFVFFFLSLQFAEFNTYRYSEFNYFILLSRFWELLAGSILAYMELEYGKIRNQFLNSVMPVAGLFMILWFLLQFETGPAHPGFATFVPVLGTAFIIAFASKEDLVGRVLGSKPFVAIGLISYSLYLWHMPVFVFFGLMQPDHTDLDTLGWIVLSVLLAAMSYFLVEQPFRNRKLITKKPFFLTMVAVAVTILSFSFFGDPVNGNLLLNATK